MILNKHQNILKFKIFEIHGSYPENGKEINFIRQFKGANLRKIVIDAISEWPSDEWKDWNTM